MKFKNYIGVFAALALVAAVSLVGPLHMPTASAAGPTTWTLFTTAASGSDPCQNPSLVKASAPIAITSATTTNLLSAVAGDYITVCKFQFYGSGTSPTFEFEYGTTTSTACDTGATALTGTIPITTTTIFASVGSDG